jgi:hypothetical protein
MTARLALFAGMLAVVVQGCAAGAGSCAVTVGSSGYCIDYVGSSYTVDSVKAACPAAVGTYSAGSCASSTGKKCVFFKGTSTEYDWVFTGTDATANQSLCTTAQGTYE